MWSTRDEVRLARLEKAVSYLACQVKNGGGGTETDPVFTASPAHSITQADIDNWNAGAVEVDTLETVVNRGAYSPKPISFLSSSSSPSTGDPIGAIGIHKATYSYYFGDFSQAATGLYNVSMSYGALQKLTSGEYNVAIGVFAGKELTTGKSNTFIGSLVGQKTTTGNFNTMFGRQAGNENTTGYKNTYFGTYAGYNNSTSNLNVMIGYKAGNQTPMGDRNLFLGSFAGQGVTGTNNLILGIGAGNGDGAISNRLIIHNNTTLTGYGADDTQEGTLGSPTQGNLANALITGAFDQRWVKLNGYLQIGSAYMPNAQGDATYTKNIVAKPDGTFGWEDKATTGGLKPSVKILDYTQDATNYILRVSSNQGNPIASYGTPYFQVGIHSTPVIAQNITVQEDLINQLTGTTLNVPMQGRVSTILIPKATNTSPAWNNDIVGIIVTLLAVDNGDGGASSPYNPRRIASDVDLIGNIRPKLKDIYDKYTGIKNVTYTADATNYYIDGRLDIGVQGMLANGSTITLDSFYFNGIVQTGTGITVSTSGVGHYMFPQTVPDVLGNNTSMGYTTLPFRVTIPKSTNPAPGYNNGGTNIGFVLRFSAFSSTHAPIVIPYSLPALFTSPSAIQATTINASSLPNANGDATYVRNLVQKTDGTIGYVDSNPTPTVTTATVNTASYPEITTVYINKLSKKNSVVQLNLNLVMENYAGGGQFFLASLPVGYRPTDNVLIQANVRYTQNGTSNVKIINLLASNTGELSIFENFPTSTYMEIYIGTQFTQF